uniref:Uncharacterized protein n=1 Tax=Arundo donax TaxID=35708 RepID=A0A0A9AGK2_ARUDO
MLIVKCLVYVSISFCIKIVAPGLCHYRTTDENQKNLVLNYQLVKKIVYQNIR